MPPPPGGFAPLPPTAPMPGGGPPMPPMFFPPGLFKPQRSFARAIFTTLASLILAASVLLNLFLVISAFAPSPPYTKTTIAEGDPNQKVAVVPLKGQIFQFTAEKFNGIIDVIEKDSAVKAVVLEIETPGGAVTPSDQMYERIVRLRAKRPNLPVVVSMGGMATSGGYYVACAGTYLMAEPTTLTGNIGVLLPRYNVAKLAEKYGVEEATITAPAKGYKNAGSMFAPMRPEDTQYFQALIDEMYGNFKKVVTTGRGTKLVGTIDQIADGRVYTAKQALSAGLVDEIAYPTQAYAKAAKDAGVSNPTVIRYSPRPPSIFDALSGGEARSNVALGGQAGPAGGVTGGVTVNGLNVNVDSGFLEDLSRPRPMYLWRGQ